MIDEIIETLKKNGVKVNVRECRLPVTSTKARKNHNKRKLSDDNVREIRNLIKKKNSYSTIARRFGVNPTVISQIEKGLSYKYVI